jgi:predicted RNA-binding Zn ribbon-like protein
VKSPLSEPAEAKKSGKERPPHFDLIAGNVCLDFVNTLDDRYTTAPKELLATYGDLIRFGEDAGLLDSRQVHQLVERSYLDPQSALKVLLWGRELREAIHDVFWAIINRREVPAAALAKLNAAVQDSAAHLRLVAGKSGFEWKFDDLRALDSVLWPIVRAAGELLVSQQLPYVRACFSKSCEWFFLDTSKNHQRRWCDMTRCGNREKFRNFYKRQKKSVALKRSR